MQITSIIPPSHFIRPISEPSLTHRGEQFTGERVFSDYRSHYQEDGTCYHCHMGYDQPGTTSQMGSEVRPNFNSPQLSPFLKSQSSQTLKTKEAAMTQLASVTTTLLLICALLQTGLGVGLMGEASGGVVNHTTLGASKNICIGPTYCADCRKPKFCCNLVGNWMYCCDDQCSE